MGKPIVRILFAVLALATAVLGNNVDQGALEALPDCVKQCSGLVLPAFSCTPSEECFCDNDQLQAGMAQCLTARCTFAEGLAAQKFQANTCGLPVPNRKPVLSVVTYTLFGLAAVFTLMRAISRFPGFGGAGYSWDDAVALFTLICLGGLTAGEWFAIHYGMGQAIWTLSLFQIRNFSMWFYICSILYTVVIFGTKISLVLLYLRIWPDRGLATFRIICWITLVALSCTLVAFTAACIFQCTPIPFVWQRVDGGRGTCIDLEVWIWTLAVVEIVFDFAVILLPIPKLLRLNVAKSRKIGICFVFLVGLGVTACSLVRLKYLPGFATNFNFTYHFSYIGLWSSIEAYLSQVCCCMPAAFGILRRSWTHIVNPSFRTSIDSSPEFENVRPGFAVARRMRAMGNDEEKKRGSEETDFAPSVPRYPSQTGSQTGIVSMPPPVSHHTQNRWSHRSSKNASVPDVMYHDRRNKLKLAIYDPPDEKPVNAHLQYVDRENNFHDVELRGASPAPKDRGDHDRTPTLDMDMLPITKTKPSADGLADKIEQPSPTWI